MANKACIGKVLIIGGGYAGISCAIQLMESNFHVILIDSKISFLKKTQLHYSTHLPLSRLRVEYQKISKRFGFDFICSNVQITLQLLKEWQREKQIKIEGRNIEFDYLVISTGSRSSYCLKDGKEDCVDLEGLRKRSAGKFLQNLLRQDKPCPKISLIGGGVTSIQFLFEIHTWLQKRQKGFELHLFYKGDRLLPSYPQTFHDYCTNKLSEHGIHYHPNLWLKETKPDRKIIFENKQNKNIEIDSDLSFIFTGVKPYPTLFQTDAYGRIVISGDHQNEKILENVYAAGDCSSYPEGLNSLTAQAAVRKGQLVATNILRYSKKQELMKYLYPCLGSFVSLGPWDGIGWLLVSFNTLKGLSAFTVKEAVKASLGPIA